MQSPQPPLLLLILLSLVHADTRQSTKIILPGCYCGINKPLQSISYFDENRITSRLHQWEKKVQNIIVGPWTTTGTPTVFSTPSLAGTPSFSCVATNQGTRMVQYDLPVIPPIFLKPFVSNIYAHQTKTQTIYNCPDSSAFLFKEDCHISNLPIIGDMYLTITTVLRPDHPAVAQIHIHHRNLPWYMAFVEPRLIQEVVTKTRNLWSLTVHDLCQCA